jgi:hypothetical protein
MYLNGPLASLWRTVVAQNKSHRLLYLYDTTSEL